METINYEFKRGDTKKLNKFNLVDSAGEPITLTANDNIFFTMKLRNTTEAIVKKSIDNGIELGEDGYYHITLEPEDTEELEVSSDKKYVYDIELNMIVSGKLVVKTLFEGKIKLLKDITLKGDRTNG
jgi:hypothetical protein